MRQFSRWSAFLLALCLVGMAVGQQLPELKASVGDTLKVWFNGQDALSGSYTVLSDGTITVPRIGRVKAAGRTMDEIQADVTKKAKAFLVNPDVSVVFETERPKMVFVAGEEIVSGQMPWVPGLTVRQLFSNLAIKKNPSDLSASLYRGGKKVADIDIVKMLSGPESKDDLALEPNDLLSVITNRTNRVYVLGNVVTAGQYSVASGATVEQAIAMAGGILPGTFTPREMTVRIKRGEKTISMPAVAGTEQMATPLLPDDVVVVALPAQVRVTVGGQVLTAKEQMLSDGSDAFKAIELAGGPKDNASLKNVMLYRDGEATFYDLTPKKDGDTRPPLILKNNDFLYVPENLKEVYVLGSVLRSGRYLVPDEKPETLAAAIAQAGGITPAGTFRDVVVAHPGPDGKLVVQSYNLDQFIKDGKTDQNPVINPGDIVYVRESRGLNLAQITQAISSALYLDRIFR